MVFGFVVGPWEAARVVLAVAAASSAVGSSAAGIQTVAAACHSYPFNGSSKVSGHHNSLVEQNGWCLFV